MIRSRTDVRRVIAVVVASLAMVSCRGREPKATLDGAPSPSVAAVTVAVSMGACDDFDRCASECDAGSGERCRRLAASYEIGKGVEKDEAHATRLYERACDLGDAPACVLAGRMHEYAHGVPPDAPRAVALYARACGLQWAAGCYNLAIMYEKGRGVPADRAKAVDLYGVACSAGAKAACANADALRGGSRSTDASH